MRSALRLPIRPWPAALLLGLVAELLFAIRLTTPHKLVFDEVHYVPAARTLLALSHPQNIEHPLLGKTIIAAGIALFGDGPLGWRFPSTLAASAVVMGVFAILWLLYGRMRTAMLGAIFALLNFTVFIQARIAMLDGFLAAFVVLALAAMLWSMKGSGRAVWGRWLIGSVLLGFAVGTKWTAVPYVAFAGTAFLIIKWQEPQRWPGMGIIGGLATLGIASVSAYFLTFAPAFFYQTDPLTLSTLIPFQKTMYLQQTQVLPPHTYQSNWTTWAFDIRPIWYLYEPVDGAQRGILLLGNPAIIWGGFAAVFACLWAWAREREVRAGAVAAVWIGSYAMWAVIPKSLGFFYYYYLSSIWLALCLAAAFDHWRERRKYWDEMFLLAVALLFVHFYPIIAATALPDPQAFRKWMWLPTWP